MKSEVKMPALSPTMEKGTVAKWLVAEGDAVKAGDLLAEIETDKATMEFEAADDGFISKILVAEGTDDVPVGAILALLSSEPVTGSDASGSTSGGPVPPPAASDDTAGKPKEKPAQNSDVPHARLAPKVNISPLAARIAAAHGIDLQGVTGSGPWGRVVKADLGLPAKTLSAAPVPLVHAKVGSIAYPLPDVPHELAKLSNMRKTIAQRLTESKQQIPHIYLGVSVEMDAFLRLRKDINEAIGANGPRISVNDLVIKALALALIEVPACNVQFNGDSLAHFHRADISVAVSVPKGLITPVVRSADTKSISAIASEMADLAGRAREGALQPPEYQGGTASLSNLGMFRIPKFGAVINPPQAMIMAVGSAEERVIVRGGEPCVASVLEATGSFDHRAVDGSDAAALMGAFKDLVESPLRLIA